jgi:hypothetical protein
MQVKALRPFGITSMVAILAIIAPREYRQFCGIRTPIEAAPH